MFGLGVWAGTPVGLFLCHPEKKSAPVFGFLGDPIQEIMSAYITVLASVLKRLRPAGG